MKRLLNKIVFMSLTFMLMLSNCLAYSLITSNNTETINEEVYLNNGAGPYGIWSLKTVTINNESVSKHLFCLDPGDEMVTNATYEAIENQVYIDTSFACGVLQAYKDGINEFTSLEGGPDGEYYTVQKYIWENANTPSCELPVKSTENLSKGTISISTDSRGLTLSSDKKYYVSKKIKINKSNLIENDSYTISIDGITGAFVSTKESGATKADALSKSTVSDLYLYVPVDAVTNNLNVKITLKGKYESKKITYVSATVTAFEYKGERVDGTNYQRLALIETNDKYEYPTAEVQASETFTIPTGSIEIIKTNTETKEKMPGVKFKLYDSTGNVEAKDASGNLIGELITDAEGKIRVDNLLYGDYILKEIETPEGYLENVEVSLPIQIVNSQVKTIPITNNPIKTKISKKDITDESELEGAHITILDTADNIIHEFDSSKEPYEFYLGPGKYKLKETAAPEGYDVIQTVFEFEILNNGNVKLINVDSDEIKTVKNEIIVYNTPTPIIVEVPSTSKQVIIYTVIGSILLITGGLIIYMVIKRKNINSI